MVCSSSETEVRKREHTGNIIEVKKRQNTVVISNIHLLNTGLETLLKV